MNDQAFEERLAKYPGQEERWLSAFGVAVEETDGDWDRAADLT